MIAFIISVNGQHAGTIGIGNNGVLTTCVNWVGHPGDDGNLFLQFGGLDTSTDEHVRWRDPPAIKVGDMVTVQVVETDTVDVPIERKTPAQLIEDEKVLLAEINESHTGRKREEE
ncbi:MAG TPA: hypothetical protein VMG10_15860 [Gemmataceae bacterium]|nr:hypothetical protein [Gemmataceae bacterium]